MLSEEALEKLSERLVNRIEELNNFFIDELGNQLVSVGNMLPSQFNVLLQSLEFGNDLDKIVNKLSEVTNKNVDDVYKIFEEVAKNNQNWAKKYYEYRNIPYIPYEENKVLQEQVKAIAKVTAESYINIARTSSYMVEGKYHKIKDAYVKVVDNAIIGVSQGRESYQSAITRTIKELTRNGLQNVEYESGYHRRLDSAVRMNIMDGIRNLSQEMFRTFGEKFEADGVEVSHHKHSAPDHIDTVDGKRFSKENYEKVNKDLERHVGELNCYHYAYPIILDASEPLVSDEELEKDKENNKQGFDFEGKHYTMYEGTQLQRSLETEIRKAKERQMGGKIILGATGDRTELDKAQKRINQLTHKYHGLSKASGLKTKVERLRVDGYRKAKIGG